MKYKIENELHIKGQVEWVWWKITKLHKSRSFTVPFVRALNS